MFSRENKLQLLNKIYQKELLTKLANGSTDGDLKNTYGDGKRPKKNKPREQGPSIGTKSKDQMKKIEENLSKENKPKIIKPDDLEVGVTGNNHRKHRRNTKRIKVEAAEQPLFPKPDYEQFGKFEKAPYYSDYTDISDITKDDLDHIIKNTKDQYDKTWEKPFTLDQSAQDRTGYEDALYKTIWTLDQGKYQHKIDHANYQYMLDQLMQKQAAKKEDKVQQVIEKLLRTKDVRVEDKNTAAVVLNSDPQFANLDRATVDQVLNAFLHRDMYLQAVPSMFPKLPENIKAASLNLINLGMALEGLRNELESLRKRQFNLTKKAGREFKPERAFKQIFKGKKSLNNLDLSYHLRKNYGMEEEEVPGIINSALENGLLAKTSLNDYSFKGGFGKKYDRLINQDQQLKNEMKTIEDEIDSLYETIEQKERSLQLLSEKFENLRKDIGLEKLYQANLPEYTRKVFQTDIREHIHSIMKDGKKRSYKLDFVKQNEQFQPIFKLTLYSTEEGIDVKTLKRAAILFKQRLERLLGANFGHIDFEIKGDGVVSKDEELEKAYSTVELIFDIEMITPKQIELVKNEIELLVSWLDDHFLA